MRETSNLATAPNMPEETVVARREKRGPAARELAGLPAVSPFLSRGFNWYVPRYLRRHFNAVRVVKQTAPELSAQDAVICFANHPGWWDPLFAILLNRLYMPERTVYAPIDQTALDQYPIFRKLGFYGIDMHSLEGAKRFLAVTRALLQQPHTAIWMTPGGRFADVRSRTTFAPGLGHVAATVSGVTLVPVALEYTYWEERTPEALVAFGRPTVTQASERSKDEWQRELEERLAEAQSSLADRAISRDAAGFDIVLEGSAGVGGWYDRCRRLKSFVMRTEFEPRHSRSPQRNRADD